MHAHTNGWVGLPEVLLLMLLLLLLLASVLLASELLASAVVEVVIGVLFSVRLLFLLVVAGLHGPTVIAFWGMGLNLGRRLDGETVVVSGSSSVRAEEEVRVLSV